MAHSSFEKPTSIHKRGTITIMDAAQAVVQDKNSYKGVRPPYLTPPEAIVDTFESDKPIAPVEPASPPESPAFGSFPRHGAAASDEALFPETSDINLAHADRPLFEPNALPKSYRHISPRAEIQSPISTAARSESPQPTTHHQQNPLVRGARRPQPARSIPEIYSTYGKAYYEFVMEENERIRALQRQSRELPSPVPSGRRSPHDEQILAQLPGLKISSGRVERIRSSHATSSMRPSVSRPVVGRPVRQQESVRSVAPVLKAKKVSTPPTTTRHRKQRSTPPDVKPGQQPKPRTRAPPSKQMKSSNNWRDLPDYCPPLSVLDSHQDVDVSWKNTEIRSIDSDEDADVLHRVEKRWAENLRMPATLYLLCKHRMFWARFEDLKAGREFNKTQAQYSCSVDVNKVSQLWTVFNRVGWFNEEWYQKWL